MVEVNAYQLGSTTLVPNSHFPLLYYPGILSESCSPRTVYDLFSKHGWDVQWIFRYGDSQSSHYHSASHECMAVLSGQATIRFGVADTSDDLVENTHGSGWEEGGLTLNARVGDVFVIPAGVAHKTYSAQPTADFALLTPGSGRGIAADDARKALGDIVLSGFTMMGAYPVGAEWDFAVGGHDHHDWTTTWATAKPELDPVLGPAADGLVGLWRAR